MLVPLYGNPQLDLPRPTDSSQITCHRPLACDTSAVLDFVQVHFGGSSPGWVDECRLALLRQPATCHVAVFGTTLAGFCCHDVTALGMLGPLGVAPALQGQGFGRALLRSSLLAMREAGYAYAVIGWVSDEGFYARHCGAQVIADSAPGVYTRRLPSG